LKALQMSNILILLCYWMRLPSVVVSILFSFKEINVSLTPKLILALDEKSEQSTVTKEYTTCF